MLVGDAVLAVIAAELREVLEYRVGLVEAFDDVSDSADKPVTLHIHRCRKELPGFGRSSEQDRIEGTGEPFRTIFYRSDGFEARPDQRDCLRIHAHPRPD